MSTLTHCLPSGSLGTGEVPVSNVAEENTSILDPGAGNRRGLIVFIHGLSVGVPPFFPWPIPEEHTITGDVKILDFANDVVADNWVFLYPSVSEDYCSNITGVFGMCNDVANDAGHGSRFLDGAILHWWDHMVDWIAETYGSGHPILCAGFSMGGYKTLEIATNRQADLVGYIAHCPATILETPSPLFTGGETLYSFDFSGLDATINQLNTVAIPGIVGYGTSDEAVGWSGSAVGSGSVGVSVASFTGSGTLSVSTPSNYVVGAAVQLTNLSGGTGSAIVQFGGVGGGTLTGCKTVAGSGTITAASQAIQSNTDQLIANAQAASQPVTRNPTSDLHEFTTVDASTYSSWVNSNFGSLPISF